jgi:hypothetical protein
MALTTQHITGMAADTAALAQRVAALYYDLKDYETRYGADGLAIIGLLDDVPAPPLIAGAVGIDGNIDGRTFAPADMLAARGTLATVMDAIVPGGSAFSRLAALELVI